jgi:eukaryotic-like serine/threonine-protein kinase
VEPTSSERAAVSATEEDERRFLQRRVVLYLRLASAFLFVFMALDLVLFQIVDSAFFDPSLHRLGIASQLVGSLVLGATSLLAARRGATRPLLYVLDGLAMLALGVAPSLLVSELPATQVPIELMAVFALQALAFLHAALVPSPAIRTFVLHAIVGGPLFVVALLRVPSIPPSSDPWMSAWLGGYPYLVGATALLFAGVAAILARVLFGLRVQVQVAARLGQYTLVRKVGEGGMGTVYEAQHAVLRRPTAVKVLPPERAGERSLARFEREVRLTSRLTHPNIVAVYDYGTTPEGVFYYAMELLDGLNLAEVVAVSGPLPPGRVLHVLAQCSSALAEAHEQGLVHRDLKPDNVVLCKRGGRQDVVKIVDFGLVKETTQTAIDPAISQVNTIVGTPLYLAPEAIDGRHDQNARSDLYSLGAVAFFLLVGRPPFEGRTVVEVCSKHLAEPPQAPSSAAPGRGIPPAVDALVLELLSKSPEGRPTSAAALEARLDELRLQRPWTRADADAWWAAHSDEVARRRAARERPAERLVLAIGR